MIEIPVCDSPSRSAAWIGAAPRSAGRSDAWMLTVPSRGSSITERGRMCPYATTTERSGAISASISRNSSSRAVSGWKTGSPSSRAIRLTGDSCSARRRPAGLSGCVTTPQTSKPSPSSARSDGVAKSGVPQKRIRITLLTSSPASRVTARARMEVRWDRPAPVHHRRAGGPGGNACAPRSATR